MHIRLNEWKELQQKDLYFKLKECLLIEDTKKTPPSGIYRIFRGDLCLYVGQSKNIPSRLATHLSGKYRNDATHIMINCFDIEDLDQEEQTYMTMLKPIENINIEMGGELDSEDAEVSHYQKSFEYLILLNRKKRIERSDNFNDIYLCKEMIIIDKYISEKINPILEHLEFPKEHITPLPKKWGSK